MNEVRAHISGDRSTPLVVDLDGTLIRSDTLYESLSKLLGVNPLYAVLLPFWLAKGKAYLKRQIAQRIRLDVSVLPYRRDVLSYLRNQYERGRPLVLATASDSLIAEQVASHLGIFRTVLASDGARNLKGRRKAMELEAQFGRGKFVYAGNGRADLPVWKSAGAAVVVSNSRRLRSDVTDMSEVERVFPSERIESKVLLRALRAHQWVKNILVFVPLLAAHRFGESGALGQAVLAFFAFGIVASAGYMINDLVDVEVDRHHHSKKSRPFASGGLDLRVGLIGAPVLLCLGIAISMFLPAAFGTTLLTYFVSSQLYSFGLKKIVLADVFTLAVLYTLRIIAGATATMVPMSQWLLAFSVFLFLCLAFVKRYSELHALRALEKQGAEGRGYLVVDFELLASLGASSGYIAVLVLALYINSPEVKILYRTPELLWLVCLVLLYWISRVWIIAHRGRMHEDPIVFALKDRMSYSVGAICAAAVYLATI